MVGNFPTKMDEKNQQHRNQTFDPDGQDTNKTFIREHHTDGTNSAETPEAYIGTNGMIDLNRHWVTRTETLDNTLHSSYTINTAICQKMCLLLWCTKTLGVGEQRKYLHSENCSSQRPDYHGEADKRFLSS